MITGIFIILLPPIRREDNKSHCLQITHWAQVLLSALQCRSICNRDHICSVLFCLAGLSFMRNQTYRNHSVIRKHTVIPLYFPLDSICWKPLLPPPPQFSFLHWDSSKRSPFSWASIAGNDSPETSSLVTATSVTGLAWEDVCQAFIAHPKDLR